MDNISKDNLKITVDKLIEAIRPPEQHPQEGISSIITFRQPKTAALFFDKVWNFSKIPETIQLYCGTFLEDTFFFGANIPWIRKEFKGTEETEVIFQLFEDSVLNNFYKQLGLVASEMDINSNSNELIFDQLIKGYERAISESIYLKTGIAVPEMYSTHDEFEKTYSKGNLKEIVTCLDNIDVVDEDSLEWEQVLEFRKDKNVRNKIKRIIHWFDTDFVGKPLDYIQTEISIRLQDYQEGLKIHGIKTRKGIIKSVLNSKNVLMSISSSAIAGTFIGELSAIFAAIGTLIGTCSISILESFIEKKEFQNKNVELAFIHEVKKNIAN
jgi:hypothetical protein